MNTDATFEIDSNSFGLGNDSSLQEIISAERQLACHELTDFSYRVSFSYKAPADTKKSDFGSWDLNKILISSNGPYLKFDTIFDYWDSINADEPWRGEIKETRSLASFEIRKSGFSKILKEFQAIIATGQTDINSLVCKGRLREVFLREQTREALHGKLFDTMRCLLRDEGLTIIEERKTGLDLIAESKANVQRRRALAGAVAIHMFRPEVFQMSKAPSFEF